MVMGNLRFEYKNFKSLNINFISYFDKVYLNGQTNHFHPYGKYQQHKKKKRKVVSLGVNDLLHYLKLRIT